MRNKHLFINFVLAATAILLAGCGAPPKNTAEFRNMGKEGKMFVSNETLTVKRPYSQVVETFRQRAPACLNLTINSGRRQGGGVFTETRVWKANVSANSKQMECVLQSKITGGNTYEVYDYPNSDGHYFFLVDAYPVDSGTTRIVITTAPGLSDSLPLAVKNWAKGDNMGCPDFTQ